MRSLLPIVIVTTVLCAAVVIFLVDVPEMERLWSSLGWWQKFACVALAVHFFKGGANRD